ncbi:MAG: hypothetical protein ACOYOP_11500 [Microthrixaceae bacterium]
MPDATTDDSSDAASDDEVERLRLEVERLRHENEELVEEVGAPKAPRHRGRWFVSLALIVLGSLLVPVSILAVWLDRTITNGDRYVETVAPLARDKDIQAGITRRLSDAFNENVDVQSEVKQLLPDRAQPLAGPIATGVQNLVNQVIARVLASDQFAQLWDDANRAAQKQVVNVLTNSSDRKGVVEIDLTNAAKEVSKRLQERGVPFADRLGSVPVKFDLMQSEEIAQVQSAFKLFDRLATVLPWLTLIILGVGILVAPVRRRGVVYAATGWVIGCFSLLALVALGREIYLNALPPGASLSANETFFDTIVRFLRGGGRTMLVVGLVVLLVALVLGPSRPAVGLRAWFGRVFGAAGAEADTRGADFGPVGAWASRNMMALRIAVGVIAVVWFLALNQPSAGNVFWIAIAALVALAVIEVVGRAGGHHAENADGSEGSDGPGAVGGGGADAGTPTGAAAG